MKSQAAIEANARYYQRNKDRIRERERQRRLENPEKARERSRKSAKAHYWRNREKCIEYHKRRYQEKLKGNPEWEKKRAEWAKQYCERNKEKLAIQRREWQLANRDKRLHAERVRQNRKKYGITLAERDKIFAANEGLCYICSKVPSEAIDHDHDTGRVRGALCRNCNFMLGYARDDIAIFEAAIDYLRRETCVIS